MNRCQIGQWTIVYTSTQMWAQDPRGCTHRLLFRYSTSADENPVVWEDFADHYLDQRIAGETLKDTIIRLATMGRIRVKGAYHNPYNLTSLGDWIPCGRTVNSDELGPIPCMKPPHPLSPHCVHTDPDKMRKKCGWGEGNSVLDPPVGPEDPDPESPPAP